MSLLRYSAQEARNIAAAEARAKQQSALNASLAERRALQTVDADYQPASDRLTQIAELALTAGDFLQFVGANWAARPPEDVKQALGLDAVDNTSDADKPISDAVQAALDEKADASVVTSALANKLEWSSVPLSAADSGTAGQVAFDGSFLYVCIASDTWSRAALSTW